MDEYSNEAENLLLGSNVSIGKGTKIAGGQIVIEDGCKIGRNVDIKVIENFILGRNSKIGDFSIIQGRNIKVGREFYTNHHAEIGGGSCFESPSQLSVGHWFHLGSYAIVNTAMPVEIGNEVGLGRFTNIYTHGAYLSEIDGFPIKFAPVKIGNRVWIPSATVNPGVTIGDDVVIGVGSIVTQNIPSGCLAMGVPCKVIKQNAFPAPRSKEDALEIAGNILRNGGVQCKPYSGTWEIEVSSATFDLQKHTIKGEADDLSERARELLRRHGMRFMVEIIDGQYQKW